MTVESLQSIVEGMVKTAKQKIMTNDKSFDLYLKLYQDYSSAQRVINDIIKKATEIQAGAD